MEKVRRKNNVVSLIMNLLIVACTLVSFIDGFREDVIRDPDWLAFQGIHSLRFFTVLSNLFVMVSAVILIVYNIKNLLDDSFEYPSWLIRLKHISTVAVTLTFVTVVLLLSPSYMIIGKGYFTLLLGTHIYMHVLTPLLAIFSYTIFETDKKIETKTVFLSLIPVLLYSVVYITMVVIVGEANGGWPDFYNFTFGGHNFIIPFSALGMLGITLLISFLLSRWHNKNVQKFESQK